MRGSPRAQERRARALRPLARARSAFAARRPARLLAPAATGLRRAAGRHRPALHRSHRAGRSHDGGADPRPPGVLAHRPGRRSPVDGRSPSRPAADRRRDEAAPRSLGNGAGVPGPSAADLLRSHAALPGVLESRGQRHRPHGTLRESGDLGRGVGRTRRAPRSRFATAAAVSSPGTTSGSSRSSRAWARAPTAAAEVGSVWRSSRRSPRPTAGGSGSRASPAAAPTSASPSRNADFPDILAACWPGVLRVG